MTEVAPDIYDVEFKDIYEIDFLDVAEETNPTDVEVLPLEEASIQQVGADVGDIAVGAVAGVVETPTIEPSLPAPVSLSSPKSIEEIVEVPPEFQVATSAALDKILSGSTKAMLPYPQIVEALFGVSNISRDKNKQLIQALKDDGRIEYFRSGSYLVIDRSEQVMQAYMDGNDPLIDKARISELIESFLGNVRPNQEGHVHHKSVMGTIKNLGDYLGKDEKDEFFAQLYAHPKITPLANGNFIVDVPKPQKRSTEEPGTLAAVHNETDEQDPDSKKPLSRKQVSKTLNEIARSPEVRLAADRAKRKASTRYHGRNFRKGSGKKSQGKAHGKKVSLDQLIEDMNKPK